MGQTKRMIMERLQDDLEVEFGSRLFRQFKGENPKQDLQQKKLSEVEA